MMTTKPSYNPGGSSRWTLLLIDGGGRIRRLRGLRLMVATAVGTILVLIGALAALGILWQHRAREHQKTLDALNEAQARIAALKSDNEGLLARAVVAESRAEAPAVGIPDRPPPAAPPAPSPVPPITAPAAPPTPAPSLTRPPVLPEAIADAAPAPAAKEEAEAPARVEVENLAVELDPEGRRVQVRFNLRNTGKGQAEGRSVVLLRTEGGGEAWLALPEGALVGGEVRGDRGRRFSIRRFMTVKLDAEVPSRGVRVAAAEAHVFDDQGRRLGEKRFPVELEIPVAGDAAPAVGP